LWLINTLPSTGKSIQKNNFLKMKKKYSKIMTVIITFVNLFLLLTCCMIDHNGQADSITPDEIIGAY